MKNELTRRAQWTWLGLGASLLAASLAAQSPADDQIRISRRSYVPRTAPSLRVQAELVEVRVVVRDRNRKPVAGLDQEDVQVFDNGKPQVISTFIVDERPALAPAQVDAVATPPAGKEAQVGEAQPSEVPERYIALFFDDRNMLLDDLGPARTAAELFVKESLQRGDRVGVFTSSSLVTLDFTSDTERLLSSLSRLVPRQRMERGEDVCPRISLYQAYLIADRRHRDALALAVEEGVAEGCLRGMPRPQAETMVQLKAERFWREDEIEAQEVLASMNNTVRRMERLEGNRILLLASSGFFSLTASVQREQERVMDSALHRGVVINSLDAKGIVAEWLGGPPSDPRPSRLRMRGTQASVVRAIENNERDAVNDPLAQLAHGTGGLLFTNNNDLVHGVRELAAAPEISYLLAFTPQNLKADGRSHKLEVKLGGRFADGFTVDARGGYFAPTAEEAEQAVLSDNFHAVVLSSSTLEELTCDISAASQGAATDSPLGRTATLRLVIRVDADKLPFRKQGGRSFERLRFATALFDVRESFVTGAETLVDLSLREETLRRIRAEGLEGEIELRVAPGKYRLRQVVQETVEGKMAAFSRVVEVR